MWRCRESNPGPCSRTSRTSTCVVDAFGIHVTRLPIPTEVGTESYRSTRPGRRRGWLNFAVAAAAGDRNDYTLFVDVLRSPRVRSDAGQMGAVTPPSRTNNRPQLRFLTGFTSVSGCSAGQSAARILHVEAVSSPCGFQSSPLTAERCTNDDAYVKEQCAGSALSTRPIATHRFRRECPLDVPVARLCRLQSSNMVYTQTRDGAAGRRSATRQCFFTWPP